MTFEEWWADLGTRNPAAHLSSPTQKEQIKDRWRECWGAAQAAQRERDKKREIYCPTCGGFQPMIGGELREDDLNKGAWTDLCCGKCRLVIATIQEQS